MSEYLKRLRKLSMNKKNVQSNVAFIKAMNYIEELELQINFVPTIETAYSDFDTGNGPITFEYNEIFFDNNGVKWQTKALAGTFIIATRYSVGRDVMDHNDMIQVGIPL